MLHDFTNITYYDLADCLLKNLKVLAMFGMFETLRQLIDQKPSQWIKFQDWEPDKQRLEFKTVAGNKEHKFIGQK